MTRRGSLTVSLVTLAETIIVFILIVLLIGFGMKLYGILFSPDTQALNTYELLGDNINSLLRSDADTLSFRFTFPLWTEDDSSVFGEAAGALVVRDRAKFEGTIFAVSSDGSLSGPFPPTRIGPGVPTFTGLAVEPKRIHDACAGTACLCFSDVIPTDEESFRAVVLDAYTCRSYDGEVTITLETGPSELRKDSYAEVIAQKSVAGSATTIRVRLLQENPA